MPASAAAAGAAGAMAAAWWAWVAMTTSSYRRVTASPAALPLRALVTVGPELGEVPSSTRCTDVSVKSCATGAASLAQTARTPPSVRHCRVLRHGHENTPWASKYSITSDAGYLREAGERELVSSSRSNSSGVAVVQQ